MDNSIPWRYIAASPDMMDPRYGTGRFPPTWRSSLAIAVYEPPLEPDAARPLQGQSITFVKVSCSITGFRSWVAASEGPIYFGGGPFEEIERETSEYLACYGVLLNVSFHARDRDEEKYYPHILDFSPKSRELVRTITEGGEVLTGSSRDLQFDESQTTTQKSETKVGVEASVEAGVGGGGGSGGEGEGAGGGGKAKAGAKATAKLEHTWGTTKEDKRGLSMSSGNSQQEKNTHSTTMDQLYSLLTGYHTGTNRAVFLMLGRPGTLQPTNRRTFVNGLRMIEGVQDFVFVVSRPADVDGLCIEAALETGHFPEDVPLSPEPPPETRIFPFRVQFFASGRDVFTDGGDPIAIGSRQEDTFDLDQFSDEMGQWILDRDAPGSVNGISRIDRSHLRARAFGRLYDDGFLTHQHHRQIPVNVVPLNQTQVRAVMTEPANARAARESWRGFYYTGDTVVDVEFRIHAKRRSPNLPERVADSEHLLVTWRNLWVCYRVEDGVPVPLTPSLELELPPDRYREFLIRNRGVRLDPDGLHLSLTGALQEAAVSDPSADRAFQETDYYARNVSTALPPEIESTVVADHLDLARYGEAAKVFAALSPQTALRFRAGALARTSNIPIGLVLDLRRDLLVALNSKLRGDKNSKGGLPRVGLGVLNFDVDDSSLSEDALSALEGIAAQSTKAGSDGIIEVIGHTDSLGERYYNLRLSERRAFSVKEWLSSRLPKGRVVRSYGMGMLALREAEDGLSGEALLKARANNRRVEVVYRKNPGDRSV